MNRLQKKCVIGTAGMHLLLLAILIVGPAFFNPQPKTDDTVLDVIPANLVDAAVNSGVQNARPPAPTPVVAPPVQSQPPPVPAPRMVQPPAPAPRPEPSFLKEMEKYFTPAKETPPVTADLTPVEKKTTISRENIKISLTKVTRAASKYSRQTDASQNARAINNALRSLKTSLSSATKIDMPGNASAAYANYATVVKSIYERTLLSQLPDQIARDNENTRVSVTIASDGTVISSSIISSSGDPIWDGVVQHTLDQVTFIAQFPAGDTEKERHYTINFNPQVERALE